MLTITLADGTPKVFPKAVTALEVAQSIGPGLAKAALAAKVDGNLVDLSYLIENDAELALITTKNPESLEVIRHSCAHLLAQAVQSVYPKAQVTIGPVIEDGFFYDFAFERPFTPEDLVLFEAKMAELVKQDLPVKRFVLSREEAIAKFEAMGEQYKVEIIEAIPKGEMLSFYQQGSFVDLCRGPHVPRTGLLKVFKLLKVAGAYWRGDSNLAMLTRVYGTAWCDDKSLKEYLHRIEEAEKRDHRKLAKKLDLFHLQEEAPGMIFWHPNGWTIYTTIMQYMANLWREMDYQEVRTPQLIDRSLWEKSGHWAMFAKDMFTLDADDRSYAVKPMNCPAHLQIFNQHLRSYRELPLRLAEFGSCHRNEASGALHGAMRLRQFVQDDAHIFCTEDQVQEEVSKFIDLLYRVYEDFGFKSILLKLSTRPEDRVGSDAIWDKAEGALAQALDNKGLSWELFPGEGAFYGPKIEFSLKDCLGRIWQCGTIQVDFSMPERLGAQYVCEDGTRKTPVMLHRAVFGSIERFIAILLEEYAGSLPVWLAPVQVVLMNITSNQTEYVNKLAQILKEQGVRVITDLRNEKIGFKIREHSMNRVPYLLVVGDREAAEQTVAVRTREGTERNGVKFSEFCSLITNRISLRSLNLLEE
jgi:threonyl-tRNA synthetase